MNLLLRLVYVFILSLFRERLPVGVSVSRLVLRTLPNDLDVNMHMNNGRYLTICDLNRVDLFIRTGLARVMIARGWMPLIADHTMTYKKPLKLFEKYEVVLKLTHWDDKYFHMTHIFVSNDRIVAIGTSKGAVRSRDGVVSPEDVIAAVEESRGIAGALG